MRGRFVHGLKTRATIALPSPLHNALLDRFHRHPLRPHELDRTVHVLLLPTQQDGHDADLVLHARLADVEAHVGELAAHLPDDRLLYLEAGGEGEPAALAIGVGW